LEGTLTEQYHHHQYQRNERQNENFNEKLIPVCVALKYHCINFFGEEFG
jgi:hypothetical protein